MDSNGSLNVLKVPYAFLLVLMGPYKSGWVLMDSNVFLLVLIGPYSSLWILMGPYGSL